MNVDSRSVPATFIAVLVALLLLFIVQTAPFPLMRGVSPPAAGDAGVSSTIGQQMSSFLWRYRDLDLVAQAVLLFASAIGCVAMLRRSQEGR